MGPERLRARELAAAAAVESAAERWVLEALGLPAGAGVGFTTGATMANLTGILAARHALLERLGWDVEARGLAGAPALRVIVGEQVHASLLVALRYAGLGAPEVVPADDQGAMLADALALDGPALVCAQAGEVNTAAVDPLAAVVAAARGHGAWVHVDGAFGLWAAASPRFRGLLRGFERADSWALDAHKWLNVPYDSHARRLAAADTGGEVLNDVVLNQVLLRFGGDDGATRAVVDAVQRGGEAWLGGTVWRGRAAARVSFSNWSTTDADVDRLAAALREAAR